MFKVQRATYNLTPTRGKGREEMSKSNHNRRCGKCNRQLQKGTSVCRKFQGNNGSAKNTPTRAESFTEIAIYNGHLIVRLRSRTLPVTSQI